MNMLEGKVIKKLNDLGFKNFPQLYDIGSIDGLHY